MVLAAVLGLKFYNKSSTDTEVLNDMRNLIGKMELEPADAEYLNTVLDREHQKAFDDAYTMGGRRRSSTLDEEKYVNNIFQALIADCRSNDKGELADFLAEAQKIILSAADDS